MAINVPVFGSHNEYYCIESHATDLRLRTSFAAVLQMKVSLWHLTILNIVSCIHRAENPIGLYFKCKDEVQ